MVRAPHPFRTVARAIELTGAVFMSYTSQAAEPALRIADALRAATIEKWLGQSEPRGARPHNFRQQIRKYS